jgi:hypothetical protein
LVALSNVKVEQICDTQMERSHSIINPNVSKFFFFDWALYDNNILDLLKSYLNLTYCAKAYKFIDIFPNIQRTRFQIMNNMKYIFIWKPHEFFKNEKIELSYVGCTS